VVCIFPDTPRASAGARGALLFYSPVAPVAKAAATEKRGSDYMAIFVRQLGGRVVPSAANAGTTVTIHIPLLRATQGSEPTLT